MKKKSFIPQTKVKNSEPKEKDDNWIIWAAWADRITFEEIKEKTGKNESQVIKIMRKNLKPGSFRLWRKRVHNTSIKHRKKFQLGRKKLREKIKKLISLEKPKIVDIQKSKDGTIKFLLELKLNRFCFFCNDFGVFPKINQPLFFIFEL